MNNNRDYINILEKQKIIRMVFILLNGLAWYADNNLEKNMINNKQNSISKNIYIVIIIISIFINSYYITINSGPNKERIEIRKIALIMIIVSLFIFLFLQTSEENNNKNNSII